MGWEGGSHGGLSAETGLSGQGAPRFLCERGGRVVLALSLPGSVANRAPGKKGSARMPRSVVFLLHINPHTSGLKNSVAHHTSNCPGAVGTRVSAPLRAAEHPLRPGLALGPSLASLGL